MLIRSFFGAVHGAEKKAFVFHLLKACKCLNMICYVCEELTSKSPKQVVPHELIRHLLHFGCSAGDRTEAVLTACHFTC